MKLSITFYEKAPNQLLANKKEKIGDLYLKVIHIAKMSKDINEEKFKEICSKYGTITSFLLKDAGPSFKKAQVAYSMKEEAAKAYQELHYVKELGDKVKIDFYVEQNRNPQQELI